MWTKAGFWIHSWFQIELTLSSFSTLKKYNKSWRLIAKAIKRNWLCRCEAVTGDTVFVCVSIWESTQRNHNQHALTWNLSCSMAWWLSTMYASCACVFALAAASMWVCVCVCVLEMGVSSCFFFPTFFLSLLLVNLQYRTKNCLRADTVSDLECAVVLEKWISWTYSLFPLVL